MSHELNVVYLELAAAKCKQLAEDAKRNRLYPDDLSHGIAEVMEALRKVETRK
jgi:hypothetical protein